LLARLTQPPWKPGQQVSPPPQQTPAQQTPLPQMFPHRPQLFESLSGWTQPPEQPTKPGLQHLATPPMTSLGLVQIWPAPQHTPTQQTPLAQTFPQAPQFCGVLISTQTPPQPLKRPPVRRQQIPLLQNCVSWKGLGLQSCPQVPQFFESLCRFTQTPLQGVWPLGQEVVH
jgi:hypothetical protein